MTWKESIIYILQNNKLNEEYRPMHYRDITNSIIEQKLRDKYGLTPADTVNAQLTTDKSGLFESLGNGEYRLTEAGKQFVIQNATDKLKPKDDSDKNKDINNVQTSHIDISQKLIRNYGMFWMREGINWSHNPKLLGVQSTGATPIDLSEMRGIYMLYDGREVIYVGQATKQSILQRLIQHTKNRLATRWDRFSWFGIDEVNSDGKVVKSKDLITTDVYTLANALEGILIEGLEPRQNRRQGDNFGFEYYQEIDKEIAKDRFISDFHRLI